jgi:hypothetical protein
VLGSNLGRYTGYHTVCGFSWFFSFPPENIWVSTSIMARPLPFRAFPIRHSSVSLLFDATNSRCQHPCVVKQITRKEKSLRALQWHVFHVEFHENKWHLTTLSVSDYIASDDGMTDELERILKEAIVS